MARYSPAALSDTSYSHAVVEGGQFYMAGQVARDADGEIVGDDLESQTRQVFENIGVLLEEVDRGYDDIAKLTVYIVGQQDSLDGYKTVYDETFSDPYPCQTVVGTRPLSPDSPVRIEIEAEVPLEE